MKNYFAHPTRSKKAALIALSLTALTPAVLKAETSQTNSDASLSLASCNCPAVSPWSLELGSGDMFGNARDSKLDYYSVVPVELTLSRAFDNIIGLQNFAHGIFEGHPEAFVDVYYNQVAVGVENYLVGGHVGVRYNFTHPGGPWVPFVGASVGAADADAHPYIVNKVAHGLGEDFNFNFTVFTGVRYDFSEHWFGRLSLLYAHYSNGGLSEPQHENKALDLAGPILSFGYRF